MSGFAQDGEKEMYRSWPFDRALQIRLASGQTPQFLPRCRSDIVYEELVKDNAPSFASKGSARVRKSVRHAVRKKKLPDVMSKSSARES